MPQIASSLHPVGPYERLRTLIVRGRLVPGVPLVEAEVAERLGVSRTPVREALLRLGAEGLAITVGGGERPRLAVAPLSRAEAEELYRVTGALEGMAARAIAMRGASERLALGAGLEVADAAFRRVAEAPAPDRERIFERHAAFHRRLRDSCAGPRTRMLLDGLRPQVDRYEWHFAPLTGPDFSPAYAEHAAIVRAVREGSADELESTVRANWFNGGARLAAVIERTDVAVLTGSGWDSATSAR